MFVVKWWNQNKNIWHVAVGVYYLIIFRNQSEKVSLLIKTIIIFIFIIIWTCMDLSLFEIYLKFMTMMYSILFYLNLWLNIYSLNNFVNTRGYPWIPADMKKIDGYPHNRYPTDMSTDTGWIFIQRVGYGGATTRTLPAPLTSLLIILFSVTFFNLINILVHSESICNFFAKSLLWH